MLHYFHVCAVVPDNPEVNKKIWKPYILDVVVLFARLHAKGTSHVSFTATRSIGNENVAVFRYVFVSGKSRYEFSVKLASLGVIDTCDVCFRLLKFSFMNQAIRPVVLTTVVFDVYQ